MARILSDVAKRTHDQLIDFAGVRCFDERHRFLLGYGMACSRLLYASSKLPDRSSVADYHFYGLPTTRPSLTLSPLSSPLILAPFIEQGILLGNGTSNGERMKPGRC